MARGRKSKTSRTAAAIRRSSIAPVPKVSTRTDTGSVTPIA